MSRRKFNREYKMTAVKLIIDDELPVKHVAEQLQVHANSLYRWVQEYEKYGESAFAGNGSTSSGRPGEVWESHAAASMPIAHEHHPIASLRMNCSQARYAHCLSSTLRSMGAVGLV